MKEVKRTKSTMVRNMGKKVLVAGAAGLTAGSAFAVDHSIAIGAATADGTTNTTAAVVGIIAIAAVICGTVFVLKLLGR